MHPHASKQINKTKQKEIFVVLQSSRTNFDSISLGRKILWYACMVTREFKIPNQRNQVIIFVPCRSRRFFYIRKGFGCLLSLRGRMVDIGGMVLGFKNSAVPSF
jgi:hypothetical protein